MKIGEVAAASGLSASAIRYYESEGLIPPPARAGGIRQYSPEVLERLTILRVATALGFTLKEIKLLFYGFTPQTQPSVRWKRLARAKIVELDGVIEKAKGMKRMLRQLAQCRCEALSGCASRFAKREGRRKPSRR